MNRRPTRRAVAKAILSVPALLAFPAAAQTSPKPTPKKPAWTAAQRKELEKSRTQLQGVVEAMRKTPVPIGTEPALVFRPLVRSK
jgi:hypothetical protein